VIPSVTPGNQGLNEIIVDDTTVWIRSK
jgi:hypothetical protein